MERCNDIIIYIYPPPDPTINSSSVALSMRSHSPDHLKHLQRGDSENSNVSPVPKNWTPCLSSRDEAMKEPNTYRCGRQSEKDLES